jgi:hypothetical protein
MINPSVEITTEVVPDGTEGEPFSAALAASGGTGALVWSDFYGDLDGTGLTLSTDGVLSGVPPLAGTVSFTARAIDGVGAYDEAVFSFDIDPVYVCGDINNDGSGPDVADLVFLVSYMFKEGPAPEIPEAANVNGTGAELDVSDLVYFTNFMFKQGADLNCAPLRLALR